MSLDISTVALIAGALGFYVQLITSYRRKVREWEAAEASNANRKKSKKVAVVKPAFGSFSKRPWDWVIGGIGYLMVMFGVAVYVNWIQIAGVKPSWWAPTAVGIVLFSWFFH